MTRAPLSKLELSSIYNMLGEASFNYLKIRDSNLFQRGRKLWGRFNATATLFTEYEIKFFRN